MFTLDRRALVIITGSVNRECLSYVMRNESALLALAEYRVHLEVREKK